MGKQAGAVIDIILVLNPFNPWIEGMKRDPFGTYIESTTMEQFAKPFTRFWTAMAVSGVC